ncbi:beta-1,3-galactosyltransferase 5-like [Saccoglossus kowalevskii]|uniref:Hexosyltransferase n=1 Tax=Saccoglossus kowalevskii TaxID=10224 RepID=A0ABM0LVA6_SACKO|nr:PREDICTED: lactosylceramide 1,3-N-acetyl-beta-D-glucosaminyltransferase-like [Saccoglossus kowalevskii]
MSRSPDIGIPGWWEGVRCLRNIHGECEVRNQSTDTNSDIAHSNQTVLNRDDSVNNPIPCPIDEIQTNTTIGHLPADFTFINNPRRKCECSDGTTKSVNFLVGIVSQASRFEFRAALRDSWANESLLNHLSARAVFLVGAPQTQEIQNQLNKESEQYDDVIQGNFKESYRYLTLKTIMFFRWVYIYCSHVNYIIKSQDDAFVNVKRLDSLMETLPKTSLYFGNVLLRGAVNRDKCSRDYTSFEAYPYDMFPIYNLGAFYILSGDVASAGYEYISSRNTGYVPSEDAYIGIIMSKLGVVAKHSNRIYVDAAVVELPCIYINNIAVHKSTPSLILEYWAFIEKMQLFDDVSEYMNSLCRKGTK